MNYEATLTRYHIFQCLDLGFPASKTVRCKFLLFVFTVQLLSCVRLCDPMDCSLPGFPALHHLPEFAQTHVHWVSDAIQPSHPLPALFFFCLQSFPASGSFPNKSALRIRWPKFWSFSFSISPSSTQELISFRIDWLDLLAVHGLSGVFSNTAV